MPQFFAGAARNDCLPVVRKCYPEVGEALDFLAGLNAGQARLTGTGASVFTAFETRDEAMRARSKVSSRWPCFVARGLNRSPLLDRVRV
jgi:4-diphosphocytidyl-2-C-methyl-D-erythritol kinase